MRIPGFTAEAAMPEGSYRMVAGSSAAASGQVQPQACVNIGPCRVCVTTRIFPTPRACLQFSCLGFNRSLCVP